MTEVFIYQEYTAFIIVMFLLDFKTHEERVGRIKEKHSFMI